MRFVGKLNKTKKLVNHKQKQASKFEKTRPKQAN